VVEEVLDLLPPPGGEVVDDGDISMPYHGLCTRTDKEDIFLLIVV
jgi:hypothetical protein